MRVAGEKIQALVLSQWARNVTTANNTRLFVTGKRVTFSSSLKPLGIELDHQLHFSTHCKALRYRMRLRLGRLCKLTGCS